MSSARSTAPSSPAIPRADLVGAGKLDSTDGFVGIRVAHNVDVNIKNFKVTK